MTQTLTAFAILFAILFFGLPLGFAMGLVGLIAFMIAMGSNAAAAMVAQITWDTLSNYSLSVLPLFILMGNFVNHSGLSRDLYDTSNAFIGHRRGGLAMATILACGGFASVCGSSIATAATMATVALPSMRRFGYSPALSAGSIAAGGTLGILIPPSIIMVIYGSMTETSIGHLFIAGIVPGIIAILFYLGAVYAYTAFDPAAGPAGPRVPWSDRLRSLRNVWMVLALFLVVIGGIYLGVFTPTEAAGIGAAGAFVAALLRRSLGFGDLVRILFDSARTTAMLMTVLVGALIFSNYINITGAPESVLETIQAFGLPPLGVITLILIFYIVLGAVFDELAMILLTIPIFFPLVISLGYDPVWFGIIVVVVVELGLIVPPIGMNLFVIQSVARDIPMLTMYRGIFPFIVVDIIRLAILTLFPWIVLFLPQQMG
ncbi:MAG: TRAP transporter large permease [Bradyrhizobiaceae bacterium]|nr:TRAP transporter large permease [Bradyrhizobiaceae bacterium]